jgi:hypothetical protein
LYSLIFEGRFLTIVRNDRVLVAINEGSGGGSPRPSTATPHEQKGVVIPNESAVRRKSEESPRFNIPLNYMLSDITEK